METILFKLEKVSIYRIPALNNNRGYRAADWKIDSPEFTGRLTIVEYNQNLKIRLEDCLTDQLFAEAPVPSFPSSSITPVIDSSRYFVIKLVNDKGQHAFVGMGFEQRSDSFDFNHCIQDYFQKEKKYNEFKNTPQNSDNQSFRLKEGQSIRINLPKSNKPVNRLQTLKGKTVCKVLLPNATETTSVDKSISSIQDIFESNETTKREFIEQPVATNIFDLNNIADLRPTSKTTQHDPLFEIVVNEKSGMNHQKYSFNQSSAFNMGQSSSNFTSSTYQHSQNTSPQNNPFSNIDEFFNL